MLKGEESVFRWCEFKGVFVRSGGGLNEDCATKMGGRAREERTGGVGDS